MKLNSAFMHEGGRVEVRVTRGPAAPERRVRRMAPLQLRRRLLFSLSSPSSVRSLTRLHSYKVSTRYLLYLL